MSEQTKQNEINEAVRELVELLNTSPSNIEEAVGNLESTNRSGEKLVELGQKIAELSDAGVRPDAEAFHGLSPKIAMVSIMLAARELKEWLVKVTARAEMIRTIDLGLEDENLAGVPKEAYPKFREHLEGELGMKVPVYTK